jgi:hypothetical protein
LTVLVQESVYFVFLKELLIYGKIEYPVDIICCERLLSHGNQGTKLVILYLYVFEYWIDGDLKPIANVFTCVLD